MALPHIKNSKAGINREEPIYKNLFEVYFSLPASVISATGAEDVNRLSEQIKNISGLDTLTTMPEVKQQQFMGTNRSYLGAKLSDTSHTLTMSIQLNLRDATDNYIFKIFKAWQRLIYNPETGERALKVDYVADFLRVVQYNKAGDIFRDITYHDVMLTKVDGVSELAYDSDDLMEINLEFKSDWADDIDA